MAIEQLNEIQHQLSKHNIDHYYTNYELCYVEWGNDRDIFVAMPLDNGNLAVQITTEMTVEQAILAVQISTEMTVEQAIEAALKKETCRNVSRYTSEFICSECGARWATEDIDLIEPTLTLGDGLGDLPHYCQGCGRRIEWEEF